MLELQRKFIKKSLWKNKIVVEVDSLIDKLYSDEKLNEFMTTDTIYTIVMINLSLQHPIFKRMLSKMYLYDLEFELTSTKVEDLDTKEKLNPKIFDEDEYNDLVTKNTNSKAVKIQKLISSVLEAYAEYVYVNYISDRYYVMVKFKDLIEGYDKAIEVLKVNLEEDEMIKDSFKLVFNEKIITVEKGNLKNTYEELISHVKAIKLPLHVVDDECPGLEVVYREIVDVYIQLEYTDKWPKDSHAVGYAKTAFYCEIYKRSKFRHYVDEECVVLKYKNVYFRITIIEQMKVDFILKKTLYKSLNTPTKTVPNVLNNIKMVKKYLSAHGYYPYYFNDFIVDLMCLSMERINCPSRFLKEFLKFNFEHKKINVETLEVQVSPLKRFCIFKKLDNLFVDLPDVSVVKRLKFLNKIQLENSFDLLDPNYFDYDCCLSYAPKEGFSSLEENGTISKFIDWKVLNKPEVKKKTYIYYSGHNKMVMIKGKQGCDVIGLLYYLLSTTSYKYFFINKKIQ